MEGGVLFSATQKNNECRGIFDSHQKVVCLASSVHV